MTNLVKLSLTYEQLAREKIVDNYAWHKKAWKLFEHHSELKKRKDKSEREKGPTPFLSRYSLKRQCAELLLLSKYEPRKPDWCSDRGWHVLTVSDDYLSQSTYFFDLYANPTRKLKKPNSEGGFTKNGRRSTMMDKVSQIEWLIKKGEIHGFVLKNDIPVTMDKPINHFFNKNGTKGLHIGVRFQGVLEVTSQEKFKKAFYDGIGTAKGFGFGLLVIKPLII